MHENENEVPSRDSAAVNEEVVHEGPTVEERQAEEFAAEMHAEPKNIDGEPGEPVNNEAEPGEPPAEAPETEAPPAEAPMAEANAAEAPAEPTRESGDQVPEFNESPGPPRETLSADEILAPDAGKEAPKWPAEDAELTAMLEAVIYITDEPLTLEQICTALEQPRERIKRLLNDLVVEWQKPQHGLSIREVAGGYKMTTKPEHHDAVRQFVKSLKAPMKLSLPALETLAVIAYKQPVTAPEIMEIRGVQGAGVLKTLIDRKLIAPAGRKNVIGKPILYKTTKEFLIQFGLKDLSELPSVKEFEELARFATSEPDAPEASEAPAASAAPAAQTAPDAPPEPEAAPAPDAAPALDTPGEEAQAPEAADAEPQEEPGRKSETEPVAE